MKRILLLAIILIIPAIVFAQDASKKKAYFFYGDQCPHCKKVEAFFQDNGIYDKYDITSLEFSNPFNGRLLLKFGDAFNDPNKGGVPAIAFGDKFIVGDQPIMDNFAREIDAADNANELPDPDKISKNESKPKDWIPMSSYETEKKGINKKILGVSVIVLVVIAGIVIIYLKSKKKTNS